MPKSVCLSCRIGKGLGTGHGGRGVGSLGVDIVLLLNGNRFPHPFTTPVYPPGHAFARAMRSPEGCTWTFDSSIQGADVNQHPGGMGEVEEWPSGPEGSAFSMGDGEIWSWFCMTKKCPHST